MGAPLKKTEYMKEKSKVIEPTKYKPEYCKLLEDHLASGCTINSFGGEIGAADSTIYQWLLDFPEFKKAKISGYKKQLKVDEQLLRALVTGIGNDKIKPKDMNVTALIFKMKTVHHRIYGDQSKIEMSVQNKTVEDLIRETKNKNIKELDDTRAIESRPDTRADNRNDD